MSVLSAIRLCAGYALPSGEKMTLVRDLSFALDAGEILTVIGANGAGKSTLLRTLAGLQKPESGDVAWLGRNLTEIPTHQRAKLGASLFREFARVSGFTVRDLVEIGRHPHTGFFGKIKSTDRDAVSKALTTSGIEDLADRQIAALSDGEFQKAMLAKMLAQETQLIFLDEPTTHLDLPSSIAFIKILKTLGAESQKTIVFTSHDLALAFKLSDQILLLDGSGSHIMGTPEMVANHPKLQLFLKDSGMTFKEGNLIFDF